MTPAFLAGTLSMSAMLLRAALSGRHIKELTVGALMSNRKMIRAK